MAFPADFLDELVARNDVVDVVGEYVQLTKKSGSNMFGLCPFHSEKTPSFSVSADKQIYHCFGCGKGGGVINFIMEVEGLGYRDAVEFLAKRAGMQMPEDGTPQEVRDRRARLLSLNRDAARFYYSMLSKPEGKEAVEYIKKRGISKEMVTRFGLGVAPDGWNYLTNTMLKKGYTYQELFDAGLCKRARSGNGSFYDTFRNRLMFPVIDIRGSVIGFSGRALGDNEPKYLNSPDTPVFNKSRNLFAMNLAKKTKEGMIILVEGNVDVVSLHQAGFDCAVASLGTSLTAEQARLMTRYVKKVVIAYDSDGAGVKAAQRALPILEKAGLEVKVLRLSGAKDPDEFIKSKGPDAFRILLEKSDNHIDYRLSVIRSKYVLETDDGRIAYLNEAADMLAGLSNDVERDVYSVRVAEETKVSPDAVKNEVKKKRRSRMAREKKRREQDMLKLSASIQPSDSSIKYTNIISAAAEEGIIRLILLDPELCSMAEGLSEQDFSSPYLWKVFSLILRRRTEGKDITASAVMSELEASEAQHLSLIIQKPEVISDGKRSLKDYIEKIKAEQLKKNTSDLAELAKLFRDKKGYTE